MYNDETTRAHVEAQAAQQVAVQEAREWLISDMKYHEYSEEAQRHGRVLLNATVPTPARAVRNDPKPCPFCGGQAKTEIPSAVYNNVTGKWFYLVHVICTNLLCRATLWCAGDTKKQATEAAVNLWNVRTTAPTPAQEGE